MDLSHRVDINTYISNVHKQDSQYFDMMEAHRA